MNKVNYITGLFVSGRWAEAQASSNRGGYGRENKARSANSQTTDTKEFENDREKALLTLISSSFYSYIGLLISSQQTSWPHQPVHLLTTFTWLI